LNGSGATDFIETTLNINFTRVATFGKRHHSLPYNIFYVSPLVLPPKSFFSGFLSRSPKIGTFVVSKLWTLLSFSNQVFLENEKKNLVTIKRIFPTMYNMPQLELI